MLSYYDSMSIARFNALGIELARNRANFGRDVQDKPTHRDMVKIEQYVPSEDDQLVLMRG